MRSRTPSALFALTLLIIVCTAASPAQNAKAGGQDTTRVQRTDPASDSAPQQTLWGDRRFIGTVLSVLIPGSGQTYLGHTEKGAAFTLGTLACGLVTALSENNTIGRNERLTELTAQYRIATNYIGSDTLWTKMVSTKSLLDQTVSRRNLFLKLTVAFWIANVVDMVFFTDDKGEKPFGSLQTGKQTTFALVPDPKNGVNAVLTIQF
jgi:TM2 domain-containing membrane protein YozV